MENTAKSQTFHFTKPGLVPEFYADGVSSSMIGVPVSKLMFHTTESINEDGSENRVAKFQLVMPTAALLELARNILAGTTSAQSTMETAFDNAKAHALLMIKDVSITAAPTSVPQTPPED